MRPINLLSYTVVFLISLSLVLISCGPANDEPERAVLAPATLHWITWETQSEAEQTVIEQFQEAYPQVEFQREQANAAPQRYFDQTPRPDLINMDVGYELDQAIRQQQVADLTELWTQTGLFDAVPASMQKLSERDGKQYYVPVAFGWEVFYYNKQVFAQYGLEPPQTWDEFLALCETLFLNGETPLAIAGSESFNVYPWFEYLNLRLNGPDFHRALLAGKERFDDPRVRTVMETWRSLFANGYFIADSATMGGLSVATALVRNDQGMLGNQKAVMALMNTYTYGGLPGVFQDELAFFPFPVMDSALPVAEVIEPFGYVVPAGAEHFPAAITFLEYLSSAEAQGFIAQHSMFQSIKYAPARTDVSAERMTAGQRDMLALLNEADDTVVSLFYALPRSQFFGPVSYEFTRFVREPHDVDRFIQTLEEVRQKMVEQGLLYPDEE